MVNREELKKSLIINKFELDEELIKQPALFYQISEAYVQAVAIRDTKKEELASVDAKLDSMMRLSNEKATEAKIKGLVQLHPQHEEAFIAYNEAKRAADEMSALKEAFVQRGYMIRDLAQLALANYYETSSIRETESTSTTVYNGHRRKLAEKRVRARTGV